MEGTFKDKIREVPHGLVRSRVLENIEYDIFNSLHEELLHPMLNALWFDIYTNICNTVRRSLWYGGGD